MSGDQMRVDYDRLAELERNLGTAVRIVGREFESMANLAFAVGDAALARRTNEFRDSWDKRRLEIVGNLEWLQESVANIHTQLSETDASLATGLTTPASTSSRPGPQAV